MIVATKWDPDNVEGQFKELLRQVASQGIQTVQDEAGREFDVVARPSVGSDRLESILADVRQNGNRRLTDRDGNIFELRSVVVDEQGTGGGPEPGEHISEWLKRTLPPGDPIEYEGLRNPERAGLYPVWMWQMWEEPEDGDAERNDRHSEREYRD